MHRLHKRREKIASRIALLLGALCIAWTTGSQATKAAGPGAPGYQGLENRIIEIAEIVRPTVVHIEAIVRVNDQRKQVSGSGFIASTDGLILTNHHVVDKAEKVTVIVPGIKKKFSAQIVGADLQTDVALLRIDPLETELQAVTFGSADDLRVGQWVLAIGNPYGLDGTVSLGIVSAKGRNLEDTELLNDFIQTDAMIDRGSSGGPLVDLQGKVVGINSRGQGRGIGFTIPIETALTVMRQLEKGGIERGFLGVTLQPLDRELADYFGVPDVTGAVVNNVLKNSPADKAGLSVGDILHRFDGKTIEAEKEEDLGSFQRQIASFSPGDEVEIELLRAGKPLTLSLELATQPTTDPAEEETDLGFHVQESTPRSARDRRLATDRGAFVFFVATGWPAREAGVRVGDVIERIEQTPIEHIGDFLEAMEGVRNQQRLLITARRHEDTMFLPVKRDAFSVVRADVTGPEKAADPHPPQGEIPQ